MKSKIRVAGRLSPLLLVLVSLIVSSATCAHAKDLNVLFLGDNGHHRPRERFVQLQPVLAARGVKMVYTDKVSGVHANFLRETLPEDWTPDGSPSKTISARRASDPSTPPSS